MATLIPISGVASPGSEAPGPAPNAASFAIIAGFFTASTTPGALTHYGFQATVEIPADTTELAWIEVVVKTHPTFRGGWSSGTAYASLDTVRYAGGYYVAGSATTGDQPDISPGVWSYIPEGISEQVIATLRGPWVGSQAPGSFVLCRTPLRPRPQLRAEVFEPLCRSVNRAGVATDPPVTAADITVTAMGGTGPKPPAPASVVISITDRFLDPTDQTAHVKVQVVVKTTIAPGSVTYFELWLSRVFGDETAYDYIGQFPVDTGTVDGSNYVTTITEIVRWVPESDQTWHGKAASGNTSFAASFSDATTSAGISVDGIQACLSTDVINMAAETITGPTWNDFALMEDADGNQYFGLPDGLTFEFEDSPIDPHGWIVRIYAQCVDASGNPAPPELGGARTIHREFPYVPGQSITDYDVQYWEFNPESETDYVFMEFTADMVNRVGDVTPQTNLSGGNAYLRLEFGTPPAGKIATSRLRAGALPGGVTAEASQITGTIQASQIGSIAASQITGTIQASQINSIAASQIAGSIQASQIGSIAASQITGAIAASQIGSVAASQITGSIQASQISGLEASKITGAIAASQITGVAASQISGSIAASQIGSIAASQITGVIVTSQLTSQIIDSLSLFAGSFSVVQRFATLPTPPTGLANGVLGLQTSDNTLWQVVAGAWSPVNASAALTGKIAAADITSIAASQITGVILAAQINNVNASQIVGAIQASQINTINASQITGSIAASQITGIAASQITGTIQASQINTINASQISVTGNVSVAGAQSGALTVAFGNYRNRLYAGVHEIANTSGVTVYQVNSLTGHGQIFVGDGSVLNKVTIDGVDGIVCASGTSIVNHGIFDFRGGTAGSAGALQGYLLIKVNGNDYKIPYYAT